MSISPFTSGALCPRANYPLLSVCRVLIACVCHTYLRVGTGEVWDWQVPVWERSPSEWLPGWVSGLARRVGWAAGGRERKGAGKYSGLLYLAISWRWREGGREGEWFPWPRGGDEQVSVSLWGKVSSSFPLPSLSCSVFLSPRFFC